ncbi:MAG: hypothetical protein M1838_001516 [Thelocarpon superellum]|nr:MAG: hypothetical protein M1838_001516 [Thelocarpon superellum]
MADVKERFVLTAINVAPMAKEFDVNMAKDVAYNHVEANAGYFWIGHEQNPGCTVAEHCYGVYKDTPFDFYVPDDGKHPTLTLAIWDEGGSAQVPRYQPVAVNPAGALVFTGLVVGDSNRYEVYNNHDVDSPFGVTGGKLRTLTSPHGADFKACRETVPNANGKVAYKIYADVNAYSAGPCAKIQLNTTTQAYTVPVAEYYY